MGWRVHSWVIVVAQASAGVYGTLWDYSDKTLGK